VSRERPTEVETGGLVYPCESCGAPVGLWCRTFHGAGDWATTLHSPRTNRYWNVRQAEGSARWHDEVRQVIYDLIVDHPMWIGDDEQPLDYLPERETRIGDFCDEAVKRLMDAGMVRR
jgi:hypothetical protein